MPFINDIIIFFLCKNKFDELCHSIFMQSMISVIFTIFVKQKKSKKYYANKYR